MSQTVFDTIDPSTTSGNQLAQILNDFKDAVMSGFIGTSRPAETAAGGYWIDSTGLGSNYIEYKIYTGTADIVVFKVDLATGTITTTGTNNSYTVTKLSADSVGPLLKLLKKRIANNGQVLTGDVLGEVQFIGLDSGGVERIASKIKGVAQDDFTAANYGSDIIFEQVNDGANTLAEKARLKDGKLGIGTSSPSAGLHVTNLDTKNEKASDDAVGAKSIIKKKRLAGTGQVQNNDVIGSTTFSSTDDTSAEIEVAAIEVKATENHTSTAQGSQIVFKTKSNGATAFTDRMTINSSGVSIPTLSVTNLTATTTELGTVVETQDAQITLNKGGTQAGANAAPAGFKVEMSDATHAGVFYDSTATSKFKVGEVGSTKEIVDLSSSQNLTNKTLTGASIVTPSRSDVKQDTKSNLQTYATTAASGQLVYATDTKEYFAIKDNALVDVGGGVGGINYITNYDAKNDTTGWAVYADAAGTRPVDGTGGSANVTFTRSTSSPLAGTASFVFTKDAANRQGQGASFDFTIDSFAQARALDISFEYIVGSGTFVAGTSSTDSDLIVYIYDKTNNVLIEPSSIKLLSNSASISDKFSATFQTASNSTSYRLILHCATTSANAYTVKIDNIFVSPSQYVFGTPITDWIAYTPTFNGFGTPTSIEFRYRRVGANIEIRGKFTAGTTTATEGRIGLPSGFTSAGTDIIPSISPCGTMYSTSSTTATIVYLPLIESSVSYMTFSYDQSSGHAVYTKKNANDCFSSGNIISVLSSVPILGLSSSVQMSDKADTRVVSASYGSVAAFSVTAANSGTTSAILKYTTKVKDTHGCYDTSTGRYTFAVSGTYNVFCQAYITVSTSGLWGLSIYKNGGLVSFGNPYGTSGNYGFARATIEVNTGDYIDVRGYVNSGVNSCSFGVSSTAADLLYIDRVSGPSAIAANELVAASYWLSANFAASTTVPINFDSKEFDTHGAVTTSATAWKFTAPIAGTYQIGGMIDSGSAAYYIRVYKNGSALKSAGFVNTGLAGVANALVKLNAGDYIDIRPTGSITVAGGASNGNNTTQITIQRVGF